MRRRVWGGDREDLAEIVALGCAVLLLLGLFAPIGFLHPVWEGGIGARWTAVTEPASDFVWTCSLCGFVAILVLAAGVWGRWPFAAALAAASFAYAAFAAGRAWFVLARGVALPEDLPETTWNSPRWPVHWPAALPCYVVVALIGAASALMLAIWWVRRGDDGGWVDESAGLCDGAAARIAIGSALFLLLGFVAPRTWWERKNHQINTDGPGWDWLAAYAGVVALAALVVAVRSRRWRIVPVVAALLAVAAFGFATYVSGSYALAIWRGELHARAAEMGPKWVVHPSPAPPFLALAALIGLACALVLVIHQVWQSPEDENRVP